MKDGVGKGASKRGGDRQIEGERGGTGRKRQWRKCEWEKGKEMERKRIKIKLHSRE